MARSRSNDSQLGDYQEQLSKRSCGKSTHGRLEKTTDLNGDKVWYCSECGYRENEEGEMI